MAEGHHRRQDAKAAALSLLLGCSVGEIAAVLDELAEHSGFEACRRAAGALRRKAWGRPSIDDDAVLEEMVQLIGCGSARTVEDAAGAVAAVYPGYSFEATKARLAKKFRRKY
jgi:hypothetical protein